MGEITDEDEVLRMMEERLFSKQFRLICMAKNHWNSVRTITTMEDVVSCPICESKMIGVLQLSDKDFPKLLEKRLRGGPLTKEEENLKELSMAHMLCFMGKPKRVTELVT